ncbi:uncharacterized protein LOC108622773, partial [Ceratina calcarata]|uniref:Uncharacterized protein LOC108622773 n=1 Tax=Ceratina calcarata TaxID=156304 RepID=A0AAJ7N4D7_9HYME
MVNTRSTKRDSDEDSSPPQAAEDTALMDTPVSSPTQGDPASPLVAARSGKSIMHPKIQPFSKTDPALWFVQLEMVFDIAGIMDDVSRVKYLTTNLGDAVLADVRDIVMSPPVDGKYEAVKCRLLKIYAPTQDTKIQQLLRNEKLGDDKPSVFLRRLRFLADSQYQESMLRALFLDQLSHSARSILAVSARLTLDQLTEQADLVYEQLRYISAPSVASVSNEQSVSASVPQPVVASISNPDSVLSSLTAQLAMLTTSIQRLIAENRRPGLITAADFGEAFKRRLIVTDRSSGLKCLIDSGADVSVIPAGPSDHGKRQETPLYAANGTKIATFGTKLLTMDFGSSRVFPWEFVVADVTRAILGTDFLDHFQLLIDIHNKQLIDTVSSSCVRGVISSVETLSVSRVLNGNRFQSLLKEFPELQRSSWVPSKVVHNVTHCIETTGPPLTARARRLDPEKFKAAKQEFDVMLKNGICRPSCSPWASPLHLVKKKDGSWRPCGDYRRLNNVTIPDRYPIPFLHDCMTFLHGSKIFSTIDLKRAYQQIPVREQDIPKTAIITPFGLFEFPYMTFGLRNAAQSFQRFMNQVVAGLDYCS